MNDDAILRALAAADTPPPPGTPFGVEQLAARAAAQNRRRAAAALLCVAAVPLAWRLWSPATTAEVPAELRELATRLECLQAALAHPRMAPASADATPADRLQVRTALAEARAVALRTHPLPGSRR
ncbi:MAG: hypothetical protein JNL08_10670 [Planctomycetes bacterium]|nr:hypothetical protein [Planctomycetota bacterium]